MKDLFVGILHKGWLRQEYNRWQSGKTTIEQYMTSIRYRLKVKRYHMAVRYGMSKAEAYRRCFVES